jgi:hypothetical protein
MRLAQANKALPFKSPAFHLTESENSDGVGPPGVEGRKVAPAPPQVVYTQIS